MQSSRFLGSFYLQVCLQIGRRLQKNCRPVFFSFLCIFLSAPQLVVAAPSCKEVIGDFSASSQKTSSNYVYAEGLDPLENLSRFASSIGLEFDPTFKWFPDDKLMQPSFLQNYGNLQGGFSVTKAQVEEGGKFRQVIRFRSKNNSNRDSYFETDPVLGDSITKDPELIGEIWTSQSESLRFFNPGRSLLLKDGGLDEILEVAKRASLLYSDKDIHVPFNSNWAKARDAITDRQVWATDIAVNNYQARKPYLTPESRFALRFNDWHSAQLNDYLMLLKDSGRSPLSMSAEEFAENLAVILRVARLDETFTETMLLLGASYTDTFPHSDRLSGKNSQAFKAFFAQISHLKNLKVAELSRFNRLLNVSEEAMDAFILKMFTTTNRPEKRVDLFILECDEATRILFAKRYKFKMLTQISEKNESENKKSTFDKNKKQRSHAEYLMYLFVDSPEYRSLIIELQNKSKNIQRTQDLNPPPIEKWTSGWGMPKDFWKDSWYDKRQKAVELLTAERKNLIAAQDEASSGEPAHNVSPLNFLRFTDWWEQVHDTAAVNIGTSHRVLVQGLGASQLRQSMKALNATIEFNSSLTSSRGLDIVFLLNTRAQYEKLTDWQQLLQQSFASLRPGGVIIVAEFFDGIAKNELALMQKQAKKNGLAATDAAIEEAAREYLRLANRYKISEKDFLNMAEQIGFMTNHFGGFRRSSDFSSRMLGVILTKP